MKWTYLNHKPVTSLSELEQVLLNNRQLDEDERKEFYNPVNPLKIKYSDVAIDDRQMKLAINRIKKAVDNNEQILIIGDYDADGVCGSTILFEAIKELGNQPTVFIPDRSKHGYGMSLETLDSIFKIQSPDLIITVDNGIVAFKAADYLEKKGVDLIITDHHQLDKKGFPPALSTVHSTLICGAGVAWLLAKELIGNKVELSLDMLGIATIADMMPLLKENRAMAYYGIKKLRSTKRIGLTTLFKVAGIKQKEINSGTVGFQIGPRINAMGRLNKNQAAFKLLTTNNPDFAVDLATQLNQINTKRRDMTQESLDLAITKVKSQLDNNILIAVSTAFHPGIVGLVAGGLVRKYTKPAIVLSKRSDRYKGSARSIEGINIINFLRKNQEEFEELGGHPMAAGMTIKIEKLELLMSKLNHQAAKFDQSLFQPSLLIETPIVYELISSKAISLVNKYAPFGQANPRPIFRLDNVQIKRIFTMGKNKSHLKLIVSDNSVNSALKFNAIWWGKADKAVNLNLGMRVNLAFTMQINQWKGKKSIQLIIKDIHEANQVG